MNRFLAICIGLLLAAPAPAEQTLRHVQAGPTPAQALQVATWNGAKSSRVLDDRGSIAVGKRAGLALFDGDPTTDTADVRKVALVLRDDAAYYPSGIDAALGIKPFAEPVRTAGGSK